MKETRHKRSYIVLFHLYEMARIGIFIHTENKLDFPRGSAGKESACNAGDLGSILGWEDPLEKGKATHSSILAWRIPWTA